MSDTLQQETSLDLDKDVPEAIESFAKGLAGVERLVEKEKDDFVKLLEPVAQQASLQAEKRKEKLAKDGKTVAEIGEDSLVNKYSHLRDVAIESWKLDRDFVDQKRDEYLKGSKSAENQQKKEEVVKKARESISEAMSLVKNVGAESQASKLSNIRRELQNLAYEINVDWKDLAMDSDATLEIIEKIDMAGKVIQY